MPLAVTRLPGSRRAGAGVALGSALAGLFAFAHAGLAQDAGDAALAPDAVVDATETPSAIPSAASALPSGEPSATPSAAPPESGVVVFGGDVVPHEDLLVSFREHGASRLFEPLAPVLRAATVALFNFETPAAPDRPETEGQLRFNVHEPFVRAVREAGFHGASVANNHSFDMGVAGVASTVELFRRSGLRPAGGALAREDPLAPAEFTVAGRTLCVFAATRLLNYSMRMPGSSEPRIGLARDEPRGESRLLLNAVRAARGRCGAIVVSLHAGTEYVPHADAGEQRYFREVAEAGADAVIGHHPHVPQRVTEVSVNGRRVPLFFSIGNLVSNQGASADAVLLETPSANPSVPLDARTRVGLLAVLRFAQDAQPGRLRLERFGYLPVWTVNTHRVALRRHEPLTIAAALMPHGGGGDAGLRRVWERTVEHVGAAYLLAPSDVPGAAEAHAVGDRVVMANRRGETAVFGRR